MAAARGKGREEQGEERKGKGKPLLFALGLVPLVGLFSPFFSGGDGEQERKREHHTSRYPPPPNNGDPSSRVGLCVPRPTGPFAYMPAKVDCALSHA